MSALTFLLISILCGGMSLGVVAIANHKTRKQLFIKHKLQQLRFHVEELENRVISLDTLCENRAIPKLLNDDVIDRYEAMLELQPDSASITASLENAKARQKELSDLTAPRIISRVCDSDAHIAKQQACVTEAARILRRQQTKGKITSTELKMYLDELTWLHLQIEVLTFIAHGHKNLNRHDQLTATGFYKKAQSALLRSQINHVSKAQLIKEVNDILFNKRRAISEDLMPESQFNPSEETVANANPLDAIKDVMNSVEQAQPQQNRA